MSVLGWVTFLIALLVSVMIHEWGHYITAKRFGMKVPEFFVGFGPRVWSFKRGETEYGIKAIPAGGYCKITGMTPLEELSPEDEPRAFYKQGPWKRFIVLVGGSFMHFVIAIVLLMIIAMAVGLPNDTSPTTKVGTVSACVPASETAVCAKGDPESPAKKAGLKPGDQVTSFNGAKITGWKQLQTAIHKAPAGPTKMTVSRGGTTVPITVDLVSARGGQKVSFLGMSPYAPPATYTRQGPVDAVKYTGETIGTSLAAVGQVIVDLPAAIPNLFGSHRADTPGGQAGSVVGAARVTGEVFAAPDASLQAKITLVLLIVVSLNLFIGVLNLLPLPPMDGGHVAVLLYERVKVRIMRLRGRPDPGPVDMNKLLPVTAVVLVLLVGLGVTLILADIINPLQL
ncbi:MAG TPA: site-2 protease family protein [Streptosporangiaceae bacterium]|jgi:membrane-associated protease RseP (regulator of RpoE activity)